MKNTMAKIRPETRPYEVWTHGDWTWKVLKKEQADDNKPYARWFCKVTSPYCPEGELGDVYAKDVMDYATKVATDYDPPRI